jgi:stress response protein SCP2
MIQPTIGGNTVLASSGQVAIDVVWTTTPSNIDVSCFMVGENGNVPDDSHMVFYNQPTGPAGAVSMSRFGGHAVRFALHLEGIPDTVHKCVFTTTLDGAGTFAAVSGLAIAASVAEVSTVIYQLEQSAGERALILGEVYRHSSGWKFRAVGQGFNGGLEPLVKAHGVTVEDAPAPAPAAPTPTPVPSNVALTKIDLLKRAVKVSLEKGSIAGVTMRVGAVIDASGSMTDLYRNGTVQRAFERALAVAACMDDDGSMGVWFFGSKSKRTGSVTERDFKGYVQRTYPKPRIFGGLGCGNDEPVVMTDVIRFYKDESPESSPPAFIIFFSDGGIYEDERISQLLITSAKWPIFWQFVGIGNANYGVLRQLDTLPGRVLDNAAFFALDDLDQVPDAELYERMLSGVSSWIKEGRQKGLLRV